MEALSPDLVRTIAGLNAGMAVLVVALAYPMFRGMVTRNRLYGFRTRKSLSSDEEWYKANRLGGQCLMTGAACVLLLNLASLGFQLPLSAEVLSHVVLWSTPVGLLASAGVALVLHQRD